MIIVPVAIASLIYSVWFTNANPEAAFFSTIARAWQLAFGAILAMVLPKARIYLPTWSAHVLGVAAVGTLLWATCRCRRPPRSRAPTDSFR